MKQNRRSSKATIPKSHPITEKYKKANTSKLFNSDFPIRRFILPHGFACDDIKLFQIIYLLRGTTLQRKFNLCIFFLVIAQPRSQFPYSCVCERHILPQQNRQTASWKYINLSQIYEYRNWETEHYNSVLTIRRLQSFNSGNNINGNQTFILDSHRPFISSALHTGRTHD